MKTCPFCAEDIQDAAIKCRHCGSMLGPPTPDHMGAIATAAATTIFRGGPRWTAQFWSIVGAVSLGVAGVALAPVLHLSFGVDWSPALMGGAAVLVLAAGWWLVLWAARSTLRFQITSREIDVESGLLSKKILKRYNCGRCAISNFTRH